LDFDFEKRDFIEIFPAQLSHIYCEHHVKRWRSCGFGLGNWVLSFVLLN